MGQKPKDWPTFEVSQLSLLKELAQKEIIKLSIEARPGAELSLEFIESIAVQISLAFPFEQPPRSTMRGRGTIPMLMQKSQQDPLDPWQLDCKLPAAVMAEVLKQLFPQLEVYLLVIQPLYAHPFLVFSLEDNNCYYKLDFLPNRSNPHIEELDEIIGKVIRANGEDVFTLPTCIVYKYGPQALEALDRYCIEALTEEG